MFKVILRFSQHNDNAGICYLREATPNTRRQTGSTAILEKSAAESLEPDLSLPPPGSSGLSSSLCAWVPVSHGPSRLDAHHGSRHGAGLHRAIFQVSAGQVSWTGKGRALYERYPCDSLLASLRLDMLMRTSETAAKLRTPPNAEASFPWRATLQSDDDVLDNTVRTAMCV